MLGDLGKLIVAKGFKKLPKVQKIAKSGHTAGRPFMTGLNTAFQMAGLVTVLDGARNPGL